MLKVNNLYAGYYGGTIVHGVNLEVPDNQIVAIVGGNGAGKSTMIKTIVGLLAPQKGTVEFDGERIDGLSADKIMQKGIVLVPEGRQLFSNMTVDENLDVGSCTKNARANRNINKEKMFAMFPRLKERQKQMAGTLSGGEQQMLATARALMAEPKLLIMDEPSWGLAPILVEELFGIIQDVRNAGTAIVLIEQNVARTLEISDWGYVIEGGQIVMQNTGSSLLKDEGLKKAYLGI